MYSCSSRGGSQLLHRHRTPVVCWGGPSFFSSTLRDLLLLLLLLSSPSLVETGTSASPRTTVVETDASRAAARPLRTGHSGQRRCTIACCTLHSRSVLGKIVRSTLPRGGGRATGTGYRYLWDGLLLLFIPDGLDAKHLSYRRTPLASWVLCTGVYLLLHSRCTSFVHGWIGCDTDPWKLPSHGRELTTLSTAPSSTVHSPPRTVQYRTSLGAPPSKQSAHTLLFLGHEYEENSQRADAHRLFGTRRRQPTPRSFWRLLDGTRSPLQSKQAVSPAALLHDRIASTETKKGSLKSQGWPCPTGMQDPGVHDHPPGTAKAIHSRPCMPPRSSST